MTPSVTVGCAFHNKRHLVREILTSYAELLTHPCKFIFIFDGCTDGTEKEACKAWSELTQPEDEAMILTAPDVFELNTNNMMIDTFGTDFLVIFQDDMILRDETLLECIGFALDQEGDKLGVIGFRDGFNKKYKGMRSSSWSASPGRELAMGEMVPVEMVNRGPIVFNRRLYEKIGKLRTVYNKSGSHIEMDYCLQARQAGFVNLVIGSDIDHRHTDNPKFKEMDAENGVIFKDLWPGAL